MVKAEVIGQLLLMQSMLINLPDKKSIFSFICRGLIDIPGVESVDSDDFTSTTEENNKTITITLGKNKNNFGKLRLKIYDSQLFAAYEPYLMNFIFMVEVVLEERHQRKINQLQQLELENRVEERTRQLSDEVEERKQIEESLLEREELFRAAFENPSVGACLIRENGYFIKVNQRLCELFGYEETDLLKMHFNDITHPDDKHIGEIYTEKLISGELRNVSYEKRYITRNGRILHALISIALLKKPQQSPPCFIGYLQDITEKKQTEFNLQEQELQYRNLANSGLALIWTTGTDKRCNFFNEPWLKFTGRSFEQEEGYGWMEGVHPEDKEMCLEIFASAFDKRKSFDMEYRLRHVSGNYRWIRDIGTPNYNSKKEFLGYIGHCFDVTARREAEENLKRSFQFQKITAHISASLVETTAKNFDAKMEEALLEMGQFYKVDRAYLFLFSDDRQAMSNTHEWCRSGITPQKQRIQNVPSNSLPWLNSKILNHETIYIAQVNKLPKGAKAEKQEFSRQDIKSLICIPVSSADKQWGFLGFDAVRNYFSWSDNEIHNLKIIAKIIGDTLANLHYEKLLKEAKEKAEESDKLKSAFLANMSHEIRTPMNGILGFAELLKDVSLTVESQQEYIDIIDKSGVRMLNIINDIIDFSKVEAGLVKIYITDSNINEQMDYIFTFFKPEIEEKGLLLSLKKGLPATDAIIQTDSEKIYAVLTNLVKNAIKFTNEGFIEIGYDIVKSIPSNKYPGHYLRFYVKDTGTGIPKNRQNAIFHRFIQAEDSGKKIQQGAGLGLAIAKAYVEMMGGNIWVESRENIGSTFYFTTPFKRS